MGRKSRRLASWKSVELPWILLGYYSVGRVTERIEPANLSAHTGLAMTSQSTSVLAVIAEGTGIRRPVSTVSKPRRTIQIARMTDFMTESLPCTRFAVCAAYRDADGTISLATPGCPG